MWHSSERLLLLTEPPMSFFLWAEVVTPRDRAWILQQPIALVPCGPGTRDGEVPGLSPPAQRRTGVMGTQRKQFPKVKLRLMYSWQIRAVNPPRKLSDPGL